MPRKPNYDFERREREKAKAEKTELRAKARAEKKDQAVKETPAASEDPENPGQ